MDSHCWINWKNTKSLRSFICCRLRGRICCVGWDEEKKPRRRIDARCNWLLTISSGDFCCGGMRRRLGDVLVQEEPAGQRPALPKKEKPKTHPQHRRVGHPAKNRSCRAPYPSPRF